MNFLLEFRSLIFIKEDHECFTEAAPFIKPDHRFYSQVKSNQTKQKEMFYCKMFLCFWSRNLNSA